MVWKTHIFCWFNPRVCCFNAVKSSFFLVKSGKPRIFLLPAQRPDDFQRQFQLWQLVSDGVLLKTAIEVL